MRPRQFDLIAFDWDGTLFDSTQIITRCIQLAVVDVGGEKPTQASGFVCDWHGPHARLGTMLRLMCPKKNTNFVG